MVSRILELLWVPLALVVWIGAQAVAQDVKEIRKTVPLAKDGRVVLDTHKGRVEVNTWDREEVEVCARIEADKFSLNGANLVLGTDVRIDAAPGSVRIKTDLRRVEGWGRPLVHYQIRMPRAARLQIRNYRSG
ncbi:MAG TPA: hypothetical protein VN442_00265 [Bryobacteraceae bacterium]|nr:hypothetical protein [Bryobacteraceae bacterium]